ncbi:sugar/nucleoside kinase (ribokinase family) [Paenarthrobacter sp. A20]|nr:sugar/nucleoside kinase (ribokinase family) [Paenarthrobacter sp. A20]
MLTEIMSRGVDMSLVVMDDDTPTGLMLKDPSAIGSTVQYNRVGSAASLMTPHFVPREALSAARLCTSRE